VAQAAGQRHGRAAQHAPLLVVYHGCTLQRHQRSAIVVTQSIVEQKIGATSINKTLNGGVLNNAGRTLRRRAYFTERAMTDPA
jgi:hypothetical protein